MPFWCVRVQFSEMAIFMRKIEQKQKNPRPQKNWTKRENVVSAASSSATVAFNYTLMILLFFRWFVVLVFRIFFFLRKNVFLSRAIRWCFSHVHYILVHIFRVKWHNWKAWLLSVLEIHFERLSRIQWMQKHKHTRVRIAVGIVATDCSSLKLIISLVNGRKNHRKKKKRNPKNHIWKRNISADSKIGIFTSITANSNVSHRVQSLRTSKLTRLCICVTVNPFCRISFVIDDNDRRVSTRHRNDIILK